MLYFLIAAAVLVPLLVSLGLFYLRRRQRRYITQGLGAIELALYRRLKSALMKEYRDKAGLMADAIIDEALSREPSDETAAKFSVDNRQRIYDEVSKLSSDLETRRIISQAVHIKASLRPLDEAALMKLGQAVDKLKAVDIYVPGYDSTPPEVFCRTAELFLKESPPLDEDGKS